MSLVCETAIVSSVDDEYAYLIINNKSGCESCSSNSTCASSGLLKNSNKQQNTLRILNAQSLKVGDSVRLGIESNRILLATVLMYILPLMVFIVFAAIGKFLSGELASILAGLSGLFFGLYLLGKYTKQEHIANQFQPKVIIDAEKNLRFK